MKRVILTSTLILIVLPLRFSDPGLTDGQGPVDQEASVTLYEAVDSLATDSLRGHHLRIDSLSNDSLMADSLPADPLVPEGEPLELLTPLPDTISFEGFREIENNAFGLGEKLDFNISYGPINAGTAVMEISRIVQLNERDCYHVISTAKSNKFFSSFFKVEDRVESFIDVKGIFSWKFEQHLREGHYRADRFANYDQIRHTATTNKGNMEVPPYVQDVLSALYYVRTQDLEVGRPLYVDNHSGRKLYPLEVKVHRRERVKVPAGSFDCFVVEPILKAGGMFKHKGRLWVWLTTDVRKMPVLMKSKIIVGSIDAKLKSFKPR
jgi:hypothetical protein